MSRLIDTDDLIKMLEEGVWNDVVEVVNEQPTAYDVDKVAEQLERREREIYNAKRCYEKDMYTDEKIRRKVQRLRSMSQVIYEAIKIVKAGGVNE